MDKLFVDGPNNDEDCSEILHYHVEEIRPSGKTDTCEMNKAAILIQLVVGW